MNTQQNSHPEGQEPEPASHAQTPPAQTPSADARAEQASAATPPAGEPEDVRRTEQLPAQRTQQIPVPPAVPAPPQDELRAVPGESSAQQPHPAPGTGFGAQAPQQPQPQVASPPRSDAPSYAPPGSGTPSSGTGGYLNPYAAPGAAGATAAEAPRKERRWVPIVGAAAIAALLASAGTAGAISLFDDGVRAASLADVGQPERRTAVPVSSEGDSPDWQAVTAAVQHSVVAIQVASQSGAGSGSGVVIDAEGHVLTNNHVVSGADQVQVKLSDGRLFEAEVVGTDATTDLAVVRLKDAPGDLAPASLGDSDAVATGDPVMAIGNPLGLDGTATTGIVSALDRPVTASARDGSAVSVTNAVQTDAAVNPGNSGGPLFNANGEVIGINSSILTLSGGMSQSGSIGLGFAIPSNLATQVGQQLIDDGEAEHAFLGVSLSDGTVTADDVTRQGAVVENVVAGSPAEEAGLEPGDTVVAIGEDPVEGMESLTAFVREYTAGDDVTLTVVGQDGETRQVDVTLAVLDEQEIAQQELPGQGGLPGQEGSDGSGDGGPGSGSSDPGNIPDWLQELFGN